MAYTTITAATIGLADGDQSPSPVNGTVRITPHFPAAATTSGLVATGPVVVEVTGGAMPKTDVPAQADATALVEFHLHDADTGPVRLPNTEIPLEPDTTINLHDYLPAGIDPQTGWGIAKGADGPGITSITGTNAQIVIKWEGGSDVTIPVPDAVQGVGVADATQPYDGGVAFNLTDGTTTSSVSLPAGPKGADGANVLPGRTVVLADAWQPDFLALARERSPYKRMTATLNSDETITVTCHADDDGDHTVQYTITNGGRYRIVGEIRETGGSRGITYVPALDDAEEHAGDRMLLDATLDGTWNTSSTYFTEQVGAYWEVEVTTYNPGATIAMSMRRDDRGGLWKVELVEDPSVSALVSGHSVTAENVRGVPVLSIPTPGTYTVRGTFEGDDPHNPPSTTARGWLLSESWPSPLIRVSERSIGSAALSPNPSNKNWALRLAHPDATGDQFFPYHGQDVETILEPPRLYDGATPLNLTPGETVEVRSLTMVQHIMCHDDDYPEEELVEVRTTDTIHPDGTYRATGRVEVLEDLIAGISTYFGMLPINPAELDTVVTAFRTTYPATPETTGTTEIPMGEGLHSTSVAAVGSDPDVMAAIRFNAPEETRRMSVNSITAPMIVQHRDPGFAKLYARLGYASSSVVPAGTVLRFSVDYWAGRVPGIRHLID